MPGVRLAINGRYLGKRITGVERYAREISARLNIAARTISPSRALGALAGHAWEQFVLPQRMERKEVLWSPANTGPWFVRRHVVTMHDASVFDHPEWFRASYANWTRASWRQLAWCAAAIVTVSEYSRARLMHHLQIPAERLHVVGEGVGHEFAPQPRAVVEAVTRKYAITTPYFLFVGTLEPRKNLGMLLEAWNALPVKTHALVVAGGEGTVFASASGATRDGATRIGYVPDADLPALYSGATAVIVPSLYEGFGLTAVEGMACGAPVIASNATCFPEILGDAALLVAPNNARGFTDAMTRVANDAALARAMTERGRQRAGELSWDDSARQLERVFEGLA